MAKAKHTKRDIKTLGLGFHQFDTGLYLNVRSENARSWVVRTMLNGRRTDFGLGGVDLVTLEEAKETALKYRKLCRQGIDPRKDKKTFVSFADFAPTAFEQVKSGLTNKKASAQWLSSLEAYAYPIIGHLGVDTIGQPEVLRVLTQQTNTRDGRQDQFWTAKHETASRVAQRIGKVLDIAKARGHRVDENPVLLIKRAGILPAHKAQPVRHAALNWRDLPEFWAALAGSSGQAANALRFTILCASRTGETIGAKWDEVDLEAATWTVPASRMKAGREHIVPLSDAALSVLHEQKKLHGNTGYIFKGQKTEKPLSNMAMDTVLRRMQRKDITVHGFRSTFRDWCGDNGVSRELAELSLAHSIGNAVEQAYARSSMVERRQRVMQDFATWAKDGAPNDKVVSLGRGGK